MYRFYRPLYLGATVRNTGYIKMKLRMNRHNADVFLVLISDGDGQLEIINSEILRQKYYRNKRNYVVGLAHTYIESLTIIERITKECVSKTGEADLKRYLTEHASDGRGK